MGTVAPAVAEREIKTGLALQAGKQALLAYAAQYAARSSTASPGQMPCPEAVTLSNPGETYGSCSGTAILVGRLPWKSLGVDPIFDGYGEPLWYILRGFRDAPINFGTPGQLTYNGSPVVAMVIAPGRPLNTSAVAGLPPAGCIQQNQMVATRGAASLNPAHYRQHHRAGRFGMDQRPRDRHHRGGVDRGHRRAGRRPPAARSRAGARRMALHGVG
jgi:hypothetical protein